MSRNCKTCKWAKPHDFGHTSCEFPVPTWLMSWMRAIETDRNITHITDPLDPNEFRRDGYHNCATWEEGLESRKTGEG